MNQSPSAPSPATNPPAEGRDASGRFARGNCGGPGNPFARRVAALRQALLEEITEEDIRAIVSVLLQKAREGDLAAIKLVLSYGIGKPTPCVDPDTLDAQEWQLYQQAPVTEAGLQAVLGGLPTSLACEVARNALPAIEEQLGQQIVQVLAPQPPTPAEAPPAPRARPGPEAPRSTEKRAARVDRLLSSCPVCLGFLPGPCPSCGRNADGPNGCHSETISPPRRYQTGANGGGQAPCPPSHAGRMSASPPGS